MNFPDIIKKALTTYDNIKGPLRKLLGDHPAIKALRKLPSADQNNLFKIHQCFINNKPKPSQASYKVYTTVLDQLNFENKLKKILDHSHLLTESNLHVIATQQKDYRAHFNLLGLLQHNQLLTQENFDAIIKHENYYDIIQLLYTLNHNTLLTQDNINAVTRIKSEGTMRLNNILHILINYGLLTQANLELLLNPANNFLCTPQALYNVWSRLPRHLLTQTVFNELIACAQQALPDERLLHYVTQLLVPNPPPNERNINDAQSTHYASVHEAVSESATKLLARYRSKLKDGGLKKIIADIKTYLSNLPDNSLINKAAKRCIKEITAWNYTFIDPHSQVSTRQLLALTFLAMEDPACRIGSLEDARVAFVQGLYEIQRGYNLSEAGVDREEKNDKPICYAGAFNKLIEKLQGIHPDCEICFISRATISLKLPIIVREEAMHYLESLAKPQTAKEFLAFTGLINHIKTDGIEVIWDPIKDSIANRLFDEFGSFFENRRFDENFINLVETGQYTELDNIDKFQKELSNSIGYRHYCSQMLRNAGLFSSSQKAENTLNEHRHDSLQVQQTYETHESGAPKRVVKP